MQDQRQTFGIMLREWRNRRRLSQLMLATEAEISQRHLSFLESGRSRPSREMVIRLAEHLAMPLVERNTSSWNWPAMPLSIWSVRSPRPK